MIKYIVAAMMMFAVPAQAGILDAITGHVNDVIDRVTHNEEFADGIEYATSMFRDTDSGRDAIHWANGTVKLVIAGDTTYIQLDSDFVSGPAPDLHIYVADRKVFDEQSFWAAEVIEISRLKSGSGAQFYELPAEITDLGSIEVVIWCKRFGAFIGAATLEV